MGTLLTQVDVAQAQPGPNEAKAIVVGLEYSTPAACPNEAQFRTRAERSSPRLRWAAPSENARAYRVVIESTPRGFQGQLYEAGKATPRSLETPVCDELVDALSLMLALSLDSTLAGAPAARAMLESEALPAVPVAEPPAPVRPAPPLPVRSAPPASVPLALAKPPRRLTRPQPTAEIHLLSLSAFTLLNAAPDMLLGLAFSYEGALQRVVSLRVEARGALAHARAKETYGGVAPAVCLRLQRSLGELVGCGGLTAGYLDVKGEEYTGGEQSSYWVAPLLGLKLRSPIIVGLAIELGAELELALIERSYVLKSDGSRFETPAVSEVFQVGMGVQF